MKKRAAWVAILLGVPLLLGILLRDEEQQDMLKRKKSDAGFVVVVSDATGNYRYDPEELIPYMIAAVQPFGAEEQLLQALAILCRTNLVYVWEESGRPMSIEYEACGLPVCDFFEYKERLKEKIYSAEDKEDDIKRAVEATEGIILLCDGETIKAPFFSLSNGQTRAGGEGVRYKYLQKNSCGEDILHSNYLNKYYLDKEEFWNRLESLMPGYVAGEQMTTRVIEDWRLIQDEADYVWSLLYEKENIYIDAISFCDEFQVLSSCFEIEDREEEIVIITRGMGHGFGFNLSYATKQAKDGMSCYEILNYYFTNTKKDKGYNVSVE